MPTPLSENPRFAVGDSWRSAPADQRVPRFSFVRILVRIDYGNLRCPYLITANCIRTLQKSPIRVRRC
jgi:hypothetical protein